MINNIQPRIHQLARSQSTTLNNPANKRSAKDRPPAGVDVVASVEVGVVEILFAGPGVFTCGDALGNAGGELGVGFKGTLITIGVFVVAGIVDVCCGGKRGTIGPFAPPPPPQVTVWLAGLIPPPPPPPVDVGVVTVIMT